MKRLLLVIIGFLYLLAPSCKKKVEEPAADTSVDPSPVFYFNGHINSAPVNLLAGVDDYYMYSYFKQDSSNGLYSFFGNIRQVNCSNCVNHITFKIYDSKTLPLGSSSPIDTALTPGNYLYTNDTTLSTKKTVAFTSSSSPGDTVQSYFWEFGDGVSSTAQNPTHDYEPGNYYACLRIIYKNGCQGTICNSIAVGTANADDCSVSISDTSLPGDSVRFDAVIKTANPVTYSWNFNDSITGANNFSTLKSPKHDFSSPGIYKVFLDITNIGCSTRVFKNVATYNYTTGCYANYQFSVLSNNKLPFSKIVIYWKDAAGTIYSSGNVTQPIDSYFEILSVDEYILNENKERTKKIHAKFKCLVSNGISSIPITDSDAVFAISFP